MGAGDVVRRPVRTAGAIGASSVACSSKAKPVAVVDSEANVDARVIFYSEECRNARRAGSISNEAAQAAQKLGDCDRMRIYSDASTAASTVADSVSNEALEDSFPSIDIELAHVRLDLTEKIEACCASPTTPLSQISTNPSTPAGSAGDFDTWNLSDDGLSAVSPNTAACVRSVAETTKQPYAREEQRLFAAGGGRELFPVKNSHPVVVVAESAACSSSCSSSRPAENNKIAAANAAVAARLECSSSSCSRPAEIAAANAAVAARLADLAANKQVPQCSSSPVCDMGGTLNDLVRKRASAIDERKRPSALQPSVRSASCGSGDARATNLRYFYAAAIRGLGAAYNDNNSLDPEISAHTGFAALPCPLVPEGGEFTQVRRLAKAIHGEIFMYRWSRVPSRSSKTQQEQDCDHNNGDNVCEVAVKKLLTERIARNIGKDKDERLVHLDSRNAPDPEDALTEIGVLTYLSQQRDLPQYLLKMHGIFKEDDRHTLLVTEFAEGGELFSVAASGKSLPEADVKQYVWQMLQAVAYLHLHRIGHRDVSLENVLVKDGNIRLMDFGMAVQSHSASGTELRYFRMVGKDFYRAPECYVPAGSEIRAVAPDGSSPGDVVLVASGPVLCEAKLPPGSWPGQICTAELWGYAAQPADVFSSGICIFILAWQSPPWHRASLQDPSFCYARARGDGGVEALLWNWMKKPLSPEAMQLLHEMLRPDPTTRPSAAACLASPWFASLADTPVPVHSRPDKVGRCDA
jgi:serine/threonine protein kinase